MLMIKIVKMILAYLCFINNASWHTFEVEKTARLVPVASAAVHVSLRRARGMSNSLFIPTALSF